MFNSKLSDDPQLQELEQREQELRSLATQRNEEIDYTLREKDRKLREQDLIIRAQMDKISQLQQQTHDQARLLHEYETRFDQVRQVLEEQASQHRQEQLAFQADIRDWQDRASTLESKVQELVSERSDLLSKLKDQQWQLDQDLKKGQREVQSQIDRANIQKQNYLQELDQVKQELFQRHQHEIQQKNAEMLRTESLLNDRIAQLEKELSKAQLNEIQQKQVADDLRLKCDSLMAKNDKLRLDLFSQGDQERKQSIQLQLELSEVKSQLEVQQNFQTKSQQEWALKLHTLTQEKERAQLELEQYQERLKHANLMHSEKSELEVSKVRIGLERQMDALQDTIEELQSERDHLRSKNQKLVLQLKDSERDTRKELQQFGQKLEQAEDQFEHQQREMRCTLQLKSKEILQQREEIDELQSKLNSKQQEVRHLSVQNSILNNKYEEAMQELERVQINITSTANQDKQQAQENDLLRQENQSLRGDNYQLQQALTFAREANEQQIEAHQVKVSPLHSDRNTFDTNEQTGMPLSPSLQQRLDELKLENNGLKTRLQEMQAQLLKQNQMQKSADNKFHLQKDETWQRERQIEKLEEVIKQLEQALVNKQHELLQKDDQIKQLKFERDKILEVSQNLKVQLINSEKKTLNQDGDSDKADSFIREQREVNQDIEASLSQQQADFQKLQQNIRDSQEVRHTSSERKPIQPYSQPQQDIVTDHMQFQTMQMFDPRMSNFSDQTKMQSPQSILKSSRVFSPPSQQQTNIAQRVSTDDNEGLQNIMISSEPQSKFHSVSSRARQAATQRLQQLKQTYLQADNLFPTSTTPNERQDYIGHE